MKINKLLLLIIIFSMVIASVNAATYYSIILDYDRGDIKLNNIKLVENEQELDFSKNTGDYELKIRSFNGVELFTTNFEIDTTIYSAPLPEWFDDEGNQIVIPEDDEDIELEKTSKVVFAPYFENAKEGIIEKNKGTLLSINLADYSVCNENKICDGTEDYMTCPSDCKLNWWDKLVLWFKSIF
jgi:hypothetical protein